MAEYDLDRNFAKYQSKKSSINVLMLVFPNLGRMRYLVMAKLSKI